MSIHGAQALTSSQPRVLIHSIEPVVGTAPSWSPENLSILSLGKFKARSSQIHWEALISNVYYHSGSGGPQKFQGWSFVIWRASRTAAELKYALRAVPPRHAFLVGTPVFNHGVYSRPTFLCGALSSGLSIALTQTSDSKFYGSSANNPVPSSLWNML